ncbi:MAG: hypothetical protein HY820_08475 [Acidobacteria bacterium]|nr:hypothetical protein [Acidobacteriota bacterium]
MLRIFLSLTLSALVALGADVAGTWKATAEGPNGSMERTFVFKVAGQKLTGETTSSMLGKSELADGKVDGDNISFTITAKFQDNEVKISYKGKVDGKALKLTSEFGGAGQAIQWTGKKVE